MNIDPVAVLAVISEQANRIAELEAENAQLRSLITPDTRETVEGEE